MRKSGPLKAWDVLDEAFDIGRILAKDGVMTLPHDKVKEVTTFEIRKLNKQDKRSQVPQFLNGGGVMGPQQLNLPDSCRGPAHRFTCTNPNHPHRCDGADATDRSLVRDQ